MRFELTLGGLLVLSACGSVENGDPSDLAIESSTAVSSLLAHDGATISGITIEPETQRRFVVDPNVGLFELTAEGSVLVFRTEHLRDEIDRPLRPTDIAALGNGKFAATVPSFGYLLDVEAGTAESYFCYEPLWVEEQLGEAVEQVTQSVTFDPAAKLMYAQPNTFRPNDRVSVMSQVGQFDLSGGEGVGWIELQDERFSARGIAIRTSNELILGEGERLHYFDLVSEEFTLSYDLRSLGITRVEAMSFDRESSRLLIVDSPSNTLFEVSLTR